MFRRRSFGSQAMSKSSMSKPNTSKSRTCGTCSLCCKLPYIAELNKPIDTWCKHAARGGGGCLIYADRPHTCRGFVCGWLAGELAIDDDWFPARCKMIITPRSAKHSLAERGMLVTVEPAYPNTWRREPYYSQLLAWAKNILVEIRIGQRCIRLHADTSEEEVHRSKAWFEGREA
jgi:uncharacterized protein